MAIEEESAEIKEKDPKDLIPGWIEFTKLVNKKQGNVIASAFFGDPDATEEDFYRQFNVNLENYRGMYVETNITDAPVGNIYRAKLTVLVLKQSGSGKTFTPHIIKHDGFSNPERDKAWIEMDQWEKCIHDNLSEELLVLAKRELDRQKRLQAHLEKLANEQEAQNANKEE